jgi:hypothetical protein
MRWLVLTVMVGIGCGSASKETDADRPSPSDDTSSHSGEDLDDTSSHSGEDSDDTGQVEPVANTPPTAELLEPEGGSMFNELDSFNLVGVAADAEDPPELLTAVFSSDIDGDLGPMSPDADGRVSLPISLSRGTHLVSFVVTDTAGESASAMIALTINGLPSAPEIRLDPEDPDTTADLTVEIVEFSIDPEGGVVDYVYRWSVDGEDRPFIHDGSVPSEWTNREETWAVSVAATDGLSSGEAVEASVTIGNALPTIDGVVITPDEPTLGATLLCVHTGFTDADDDEDHSSIEWLRGGEIVGTEPELSGVFSRGDVLTCSVTANDGLDDGNTAEASITIGNSAPSISAASWSASSDVRTDDVITIDASAEDPDGDAADIQIEWLVDGETMGVEGTELDGGLYFNRDQVISAVLTPNDGLVDGEPVTLGPIIVLNSVPSVTDVAITPTEPRVGDTLMCGATFDDPDGDEDASSVLWTVDGVMFGTGLTLHSVFGKGAVVACTVVAHDGTDEGSTATTSVIIGNTAPEMVEGGLTPASPQTNDVVTLTAVMDDADIMDSLTLAVSWMVNGEFVDATGDTLDGAVHFDKGDVISASVTASDGDDVSGPMSLGPITVINSLPSLSSVGVTPAEARAGSVVECLTTGAADADGDEVAVHISWTVDGTEVGTGPTISEGFSKGDSLVCTATPHDGEGPGESGWASVWVVNSPPSLESVAISPDPLRTSDSAVCVPEGAADVDGDALSFEIDWIVNGGFPTPGAATLDRDLALGDTIQCAMTPSDGAEVGDQVVSAVRTVTSSPPSVVSADFTPGSPRTNDTLSVSVVTSDGDGDEVSLAYRWEVNGETVHTGSNELEGAEWFDKDDTVEVVITPNDGTSDGELFTISTTVANTPPSTPSALIDPEVVRRGEDEVVCAYVPDSSYDPDDDAASFSVQVIWLLNEEAWEGDTLMTEWPGDTLPRDATELGDEWRCALRVSDGTALSDTASVEFEPAEWVYSENFEGCSDSTCGGSWHSSAGTHTVSDGTLRSVFDDHGYITHDLSAELGDAVRGDQWIFQFDVQHTLASSGSSCSAAQSFWLHAPDLSDVVGGTFQDYRGFQQYWEFRVEDDFAGRGTTIHNWMSERPPSEWTVFSIVRDGTTLTFQGDGRTRTATVDEDWGDNLRILRLRSHYSSNCDPSTVVKIDNIEIRLGQTHL